MTAILIKYFILLPLFFFLTVNNKDCIVLSIKNKLSSFSTLRKIRFLSTAVLLISVVLHFFNPTYEGPIPAPSDKQNNAYISPLSRYIYWRNPVWTLENGDSESSPQESNLLLFENGTQLGPAHSTHSDIRSKGTGAYSHWGGALYFSSSDNTDPRANGRTYTIKVSLGLRWWITLLSFVSGGILAFSYLPFLMRYSFFRISILNFTFFLGLIIIVCAAGEIYLRMVKGIKNSSTLLETVPQIGNIYTPNSTVHWTNYTDFSVTEQVNSLGFVDREPPVSKKQPNEVRIAFIGDSFVESLQVHNNQKSHVILEKWLNSKNSKYKFTAAAYGYSGTGQVNQLPYYDFFAKEFRPDYVVLVIVSNDFSDNCPVHVALRNGWDPEHNPRPTVQKDPDGKFFILEPQLDYAGYLLPASTTTPATTLFAKIRKGLFKYSMLYKYVSISLQLNYHLNIGIFSGEYANDNIIGQRLNFLKQNKKYHDLVKDEDGVDLMNLDYQFDKKDMSPLTIDGIARTDFAISEWKHRAEADGFKLVALLSHSTSMYCQKDSLIRERFVQIFDKYRIQHFDQCDTILNSGHLPSEANFSHDGHWNTQGHIWAAETLFPYFEDAIR
ncbi:MAG: hypothetical protein F8N36_07540 [Desulfovibrio sp.]|nr:hypothetical protein [Desulfovibrio sp.]